MSNKDPQETLAQTCLDSALRHPGFILVQLIRLWKHDESTFTVIPINKREILLMFYPSPGFEPWSHLLQAHELPSELSRLDEILNIISRQKLDSISNMCFIIQWGSENQTCFNVQNKGSVLMVRFLKAKPFQKLTKFPIFEWRSKT